jgi:hypothetical protein
MDKTVKINQLNFNKNCKELTKLTTNELGLIKWIKTRHNLLFKMILNCDTLI